MTAFFSEKMLHVKLDFQQNQRDTVESGNTRGTW